MVYMKRILFMVVVISFLCNGLVYSSGNGENDGEIQKDINSAHGVIEISKERDKRRAASLHKECLDCYDASKDWTHANSPVLRSKRATKSKIRRSKKRLKKLADVPASNSKSFSNYFSNFWKHEQSPEKQSPVKTTTKVKSKKTRVGKKQKTPRKSEPSNISKTKGKSLVNHFSNYWKKDNGSDSISGLPARESTKNSQKKEGQFGKEVKKTSKKESSKKNDPDSSSLLSHFSSYWKNGESDPSTDSNNSKAPIKSNKSENSKKKLKKKANRRDNKTSKSKSGLQRGKNGKRTKEDSGRVDRGRKDEKEVVTVTSTSPSKKTNTEDGNEKIGGSEHQETKVKKNDASDTNESTKRDDVVEKEDKSNKTKIRKIKANRKRLRKKKGKKDKTERLKGSNRSDGNEDMDNTSKSKGVSETNSKIVPKNRTENKEKVNLKSESKTQDVTKARNNGKKYKKDRSRKKSKKKSKTEPRVESNLIQSGSVSTNKPTDDERKTDAIKNVAETPEPSVIDFQGLKSGLNPETNSVLLPEKNRSYKIRGNSNRGQNVEIDIGDRTSLLVQNGTRVSYESTIASNSKQYNRDNIGIKESENIPKPTEPIPVSTKVPEISPKPAIPKKLFKNIPTPTTPVKTEKPRRKKVKNSSKNLTYYELLTKAENAFRRKNEKIMKKLVALSKKTGKRYKKFKSVNDKRFNEDPSTATFNYSVPTNQSQVSTVDLKKMIINLHNYSMEDYDEDQPKDSDNLTNSSSIEKDRHSLPQGDDPMHDPNSLVDYSKWSEDPSLFDYSKWSREHSLVHYSKWSRDPNYKSNIPVDLSDQDIDTDLNSLIDMSRKSRINDDVENEQKVDLKNEKSSKKISGSFSFLNYYSSFWKRQGTDSSSKKVSPNPSKKARKRKNRDRKRRRRKEKQDLMPENDVKRKKTLNEGKDIGGKRLRDVERRVKDERFEIQSDGPNALSKIPKRRKLNRKEKRKRRKNKPRRKNERDEESAMTETDEEKNRHLLKKRDTHGMGRASSQRKSRIKSRRLRKRNKKGKNKNKSNSVGNKANLRSLDTPTSQRDDAYSRHYQNRKETRNRDRKSKRRKSSRHKRLKSRRNRRIPFNSKRTRENNEDNRGLVAKQARDPSPGLYVRDEGMLKGSRYYMDGYYGTDEALPISRSSQNRNSRSKSKRGRKVRLSRLSKRKRNRKQPMKDQEFQSKRVRYDSRGRDNSDDRLYRDEDGNYYYAVRGRERYRGDEYYYPKRGRHSRRHLHDFDEGYEEEGVYVRVGRGHRRRYYEDDYDDGGRRVYRRKEIFRDDVDHPRGSKGSRTHSKYQDDSDDILYYIYPVRRGKPRRRYDDEDNQYQAGRGSRRYPVDNGRRDSYPRREDDDGYNDNGPRQPVSRWRGRDGYSRGYTRYAPRQGPRYDGDSRREDGYGSSRPGGQEVRGRDGRRWFNTHSSRKDEDSPWTGDIDSPVNPDTEFNSGSGRRISSGIHTVDNDRRERPSPRRDSNYYAELEKQRQQERIRVMERQRKLQLQRIAPRVGQEIQSLKHHLNGVLRHYIETMTRNEKMYSEIFNGTRYDIMSGMGEMYEDLNDANDDIYDAVVRASNTARSIFMKAHKKRTAQIKGLTQDEPTIKMKEMESMVTNRDFRRNLLKAQMEKRQLETRGRHFKMLEMKHNQGKARLQQVKEHFKDSYDHQILLNLFNNMRASIEYINEELACSHNLKPLRRNKLYLDQAKKEMSVAKGALFQSRDAVQNGQMKLMEIKGLYRKYETEKQRNARKLRRSQNGRSRQRMKRDVDPREFEKLKRMTTQCRRHSMDLNRTAVYIQRTLERPIRLGKAAIQRRGQKVPISQLTPRIVRLRSNVKDMFMTLDKLRVYVDSQPKIVFPKKCSEHLIEGSGAGDSDDEDFECIEEVEVEYFGKGGEDDDFTFDNEDKGTPETSLPSNPMNLFGIRLSEYTSQMLSKSENLDESAYHTLKKAMKGLRQRLQVSTLGKDLSLKKDVQSNFFTLKSDRDEVKSRLVKISEKLDNLNDIDFDDIKSRAIAALKRAKEESTKRPIEVETTEATTRVIEPIIPTNGNDNKTETKPGEWSHWELFRKGKDIESNRKDIKYLESLALSVYTRSCNKMGKIQSNISALMTKVENARNMLSSLQLSISKTSDSPMPVPIPPDNSANGQVTTMSICIKPSSLDGTVLYLQGNRSASYSLALDDGELTAYVYDEDNDEQQSVTLDEDLEQDKWYTIQMTRAGQTLSLRAKGQDGELLQESEEVSDIPLLQHSFVESYIGGVPDDAQISGDPWQGCVGEFVLNGQSLSTFQPSMDGQQPALCTDNCISEDRNLTWSFEGDGFVHYSQSSQQVIESISVSFQTTQSMGSILSAVNARRRFHLYISFENGAVKLETSSDILRSNNDSLNDGTLHRLKVTFKAGRIHAELDGDEAAFSVKRGRPRLYRDIKDGVLMGSFVSEDRKYLDERHRPLIGCVGRLVINGNPMLSTDAREVYHARYGRCATKSVWQSCAHFTPNSVPISLGSLDDSNKISFLVSKNATGPLMIFEKKDNFKITIRMTDDHIDVSSDDSEAVLLERDDDGASPDNVFTLITIEDQGKDVVVKAFGQSTSVNYLSWYSIADTSSPHIISVGQAKEGKVGQPFVGSLSQLVIGNKLYDLPKYDNKLESCIRPLKAITPNQNVVREEKNVCS